MPNHISITKIPLTSIKYLKYTIPYFHNTSYYNSYSTLLQLPNFPHPIPIITTFQNDQPPHYGIFHPHVSPASIPLTPNNTIIYPYSFTFTYNNYTYALRTSITHLLIITIKH